MPSIQKDLTYLTKNTKSWGYHSITAMDGNDYEKFHDGFSLPASNVNTQVICRKRWKKYNLCGQVDGDYGGYQWTPYMVKFKGDTILHLCVKFNKPLIFKAALKLRPNLRLRNGLNATAFELAKQKWGLEPSVR